MTSAPFDLDDYLEKCRTTYVYFNQGTWWKPNQRPVIAIADMEPAWRLNCLRWLERRAESFEPCYTFGEDERHADPVAWIKTTTLYKALAAGLPTGEAAEELAAKAKHYSTCPRRIDLNADRCTCHLSECAIVNGTPQVGCTCRDDSPEWTLS